jgi:hypothetical protein
MGLFHRIGSGGHLLPGRARRRPIPPCRTRLSPVGVALAGGAAAGGVPGRVGSWVRNDPEGLAHNRCSVPERGVWDGRVRA